MIAHAQGSEATTHETKLDRSAFLELATSRRQLRRTTDPRAGVVRLTDPVTGEVFVTQLQANDTAITPR